MRKSCTQHEKVYLGGQYYVMGHPTVDPNFLAYTEIFQKLSSFSKSKFDIGKMHIQLKTKLYNQKLFYEAKSLFREGIS